MSIRKFLAVAAITAIIAVVIGCGSQSNAPAVTGPSGTISVSVKFPEPADGVQTQDLPAATNSVLIEVFTDDDPPSPFDDVLVTRGDNVSAQFSPVPVGYYNIKATGFASADGSGAPIAGAATSANVVAGDTTDVSLVTDALPVRVEIDPCPNQMEYLTQQQLTAKAYDADDNQIMNANFNWQTSDSSIIDLAEIQPVAAGISGATSVNALAVGEGTATITATEINYSPQQQATCDIQVYKRTTAYISMDPASKDMYVPEEQTFELAATAYDSSDVAIPYVDLSWSSSDTSLLTVAENASLTDADDTANTAAGTLASSATETATVIYASTPSSKTEVTVTADAQGSTTTEYTPGECVVTLIPSGGMNVVVSDAP